MKRSWRRKGALLLRYSPPFQRAFRRSKQFVRRVRNSAFSAARRVPIISRAVPNGFFSDYQLLLTQSEQMRTGRIVLEDQGIPDVPEYSVTHRAGMNQHQQQPWPIFWNRHEQAHL